jgi:RluA family pseudouridine synthase
MPEKRAPFKSPPKKYQPKGLIVLYEDQDLLIVNKSNGLLTVSTDKEKDKTAFALLNNYVRKGNSRSKNRVYIVHRLDRETSGVLVFAKNDKAKHFLQEHWASFDKVYFAVAYGKLREKEGLITSYLLENKAHRMYSAKDSAQGKFAKTGFKVVNESKNFSLLKINLYTGRKNQIRVHLADKGHPVAGDSVYGKIDKRIRRMALHALSITITHPFTREKISFETELPVYFKTIMKM